MKPPIFLFFLFLLTYQARSQTTAETQSIKDLTGLLGRWSGKGQFASGKPIEADVSFELDTATTSILYRHVDRSPNRYKATSLWVVDRQTGRLTSMAIDNFGGVRVFECNERPENTVIIENVTILAHKASRERFIYQLHDRDHFKMTYEYDRNDGKGWRLGDWLEFVRQKA